MEKQLIIADTKANLEICKVLDICPDNYILVSNAEDMRGHEVCRYNPIKYIHSQVHGKLLDSVLRDLPLCLSEKYSGDPTQSEFNNQFLDKIYKL